MEETPEQPENSSDDGFREKFLAFLKPPALDRRGWALLAGLTLAIWLSTGVYKVQPDEQGVVLRFGAWVATKPPGLHFHAPWPIESAMFPKVTQIRQMVLGLPPNGGTPSARDKEMLTGD